MHIKDKVMEILRDYPQTRADDRLLLTMVWWKNNQHKIREIDGESWVRLKDIPDMEKSETIRRTRQKLHEEGEYLPPKEIQEHRQELAKDMRQAMPGSEYWHEADYFNQ